MWTARDSLVERVLCRHRNERPEFILHRPPLLQ
jgi:hypothetical protein